MWSYITEFYDYHITSQEDPRIVDYSFMESPRPALILVALYLLFVKVVGPAYMKNRPAFEFNNIIIIYNTLQALFSLTVVVLGSWFSYKIGFNPFCQVHEYKYDYYSLANVSLSYWFLIGRFTEFIDTIFFVLRKKDKQITTLHVVHHAIVPLVCWIGVKIAPAGHYALAGFINSFVHFFMYTYYLISALGPEYKEYLWWKRHLTILQLAQFSFVIVHTLWTLGSGCKAPKFFGYMILIQAIFFYKLFFDFYKNTFKKENQLDISDKAKKVSMSLEKYYHKYRHILEMCIPNQHLLLDDNETENVENEEKNIYLPDFNINKDHVE